MESKIIDRRRMLRALGAATAACAWSKASEANGKTIIVIGAGLAGLIAARDLAAAGHMVRVIEARDRIGGRISTSRQWAGLPVDMGASWIHGVKGNPLTRLADEGGIRRFATSYDASMMLDADGKAVELVDELEAADDAIAAARAEAEARPRDVPLEKAITASSGWAKAGEAERRLIRHQVNGTVEAEYGGDWSEASALHFDDAREFKGGDELFPDGFDQVPQLLAKGLNISLGQTVTSLAPTPQGISIGLADGPSLEADHAIITVPLGVLKAGRLRFAEPLSPERQQAIESIGMGLLNKCWLKFDRIAWPDGVDWIEWLGAEAGRWAQWLSLARVTGKPVLLGFHAAAKARELEQRDNGAVMAEAHDALKAMFGNRFPAPEAMQLSRWSQDGLALGAYSFNAVGVTKATRQALAGADWQGRLIFAGEAAEPSYFGTAHGAVLSGHSAAKLLGS